MSSGRSRAGTLAAIVAVVASAIFASSAAAVGVSIRTEPDVGSVVPGSTLTYSIALLDGGPGGDLVTVTLPFGVSLVSADPGCSESAGIVTCSGSSTLTVRVPSDAVPGSTLTASASVSSEGSSVTTTVAPGLADLSTSVSPLVSGGLVTWRVGLHNAGPSNADGASVAMPIPMGTNFVSAAQVSGPAFACSHDDANITCSRAHMAAGDDAVFDFVLAAGDGSTRGKPLASATTTDPDHANDESSATVAVVGNTPLPPVPDPLPTPEPARQVITLGNAVEGAGSGVIFVPVGCMNEALGFCRTTVTIRFRPPHGNLKPITRRLRIASGQASVAFMSGSLAQRRKIRVIRRLGITVTATNPPGAPVKRNSMLSGHPRPRR